MNRNIVLLIILVTGCSFPRPEADQDKTARLSRFRLPDGLGQVEIMLPGRYDTSFYWIDFSDCGMPCAERKFRSQPKSLRITKESGFIWLGEPKDSVDRFTVTLPGVTMPGSTIMQDSPIHLHTKLYLFHEFGLSPVRDTIEHIGDRNISVFVFDKYDTIRNIKILAETRIKGESVKFTFDLFTRVKDSLADKFVDRAFEYIRSIRIRDP